MFVNVQDVIEWENEEDVKLMDSIFQLIPDQLPCDLAVICRKTCSEVRVILVHHMACSSYP